jgi:hypothetical protein
MWDWNGWVYVVAGIWAWLGSAAIVNLILKPLGVPLPWRLAIWAALLGGGFIVFLREEKAKRARWRRAQTGRSMDAAR